MTKYVASPNGDWWELNIHSDYVFVLDTDSLSADDLADIKDVWGEDWEGQDKFEKIIALYGYTVEVPLEKGN
jgi:hypothetical protein